MAEDYIACGESSSVDEGSALALPYDAIGLSTVTAGRSIDVLYLFDEAPDFAATEPEVVASAYRGRLGGVEDRGQRSAMAYDNRGQVVWTVRQMTVIPDAVEPMVADGADGLPVVTEGPALPWTRTFDESHSYERTATYDHGGRPTAMTLPLDPDYDGDTPPAIGGALSYNARGLPSRVELTIDGAARPIVNALVYTRDGLVEQVTYGDALDPEGGTRTPTVSFTTYDDRRRPIRMTTTRTPNAHGELPGERPLADVTAPHDQMLVWDLADNLIAIEDLRDPTEWPDGYRPQSVHVVHDSLYRVAGAEYEYTGDDGARVAADEGTDYRTELAATRPSDPMRTDPAPMATTAPEGRMVSMTWEYDWLGNMQEWTDDAGAFYERSLGDIVNGADTTTSSEVRRPGALYIASNLPSSPNPLGPADQGGWVEVRYGQDGNVLTMTVHAQCASPAINDLSIEPRTGEPEAVALSSTWSCASEQHYSYVWDEVNRIHEARRYDRDRTGGAASWSLAVQQRYLYDSANQRTVKSTTSRGEEGSDTRVALYVYPGDFERRGLVTGFGQTGPEYQVVAGETETQYVVGGARIVWRSARDSEGVDRDQRITIGLTDLIQSTTAVIDLATGEMVETGSYYANGARETYRASESGDRVAAEPMGFTGKEADEEVGLTYFGQRYLMSHLGRWASPDPLQTHAVGGGEAINGYHYVSGNVLQARDPVGLVIAVAHYAEGAGATETTEGMTVASPADRDMMIGEMRNMVREEYATRVEMLQRWARGEAAAGRTVDRASLTARVADLERRSTMEQAAIHASTSDPGVIVVDDVYASTRVDGAERRSLGGVAYEELYYLHTRSQVAVIGYRDESDLEGVPELYLGATREDYGDNARWIGLSWARRPADRPGGDVPTTSVHELGHQYFFVAGLGSPHASERHLPGGRGGTEHNASDDHADLLSFLGGMWSTWGDHPHMDFVDDATGEVSFGLGPVAGRTTDSVVSTSGSGE